MVRKINGREKEEEGVTHGEERVANSSSGSIAQELTSEGIRQYIFTGSHIGKAKVGSTTPTVTFFCE